MKSKDQQLLEEAYRSIRNNKVGKENRKKYLEIVKEFGERLYQIFGTTPFTKKLVLSHKDKFEDLDKKYQDLYETPYSLFSFEETQERLTSMMSNIGIMRKDMKFESGPKGMIYWFESEE
jgi:hypothetical protein